MHLIQFSPHLNEALRSPSPGRRKTLNYEQLARKSENSFPRESFCIILTSRLIKIAQPGSSFLGRNGRLGGACGADARLIVRAVATQSYAAADPGAFCFLFVA